MSQKIIIDNKEVEVFTADEVTEAVKKGSEEAVAKSTEVAKKTSEETVASAVKKYQEEHPDQTEDLKQAQSDLKQAQSDLEAKSGDDDDEQKKRLINERDEAKKTLNTKIKEMGDQIKDLTNQSVEDIKEVELAKFTDVEERKKVEFEFDRYRPNDNSRSDIAERVATAAGIAGVEVEATPNALDDTTGGASETGDIATDGKGKATEQSKEIGKVLGVTEKELNKAVENKDENNN